MTIFKFRGNEYKNQSKYVPLSELVKLYLIHKALEGDPLAIELFEASGTTVVDKDGRQIYPPVDKTDV